MLFEGLAVLGIVGEIMDLVWVVGEVVEFLRGFLGPKKMSWVLFISPLAIISRKAWETGQDLCSWAA